MSMIKKYQVWILIAIVVIILTVLYFRKKNKEEQFVLLLKAVEDKSTVTGGSDDLKSNRAFDPNYYKTKKAPELKVNYSDLAKKVYDSKGVLSDDEEAVLGVYNGLKSKLHASYLANIFQQKYKKSLYEYLTDFMDQKYMDRLQNRISQLSD